VQDFIDSFNKFSDEFPNLRTDPLTQEELRKRVTRLGNDMWTLVEQKKDQALAQHAKLNSDGWVVSEIKKLMKNATRLIQNELARVFAL
jgi:arsenate reductase-like glutaredoxin family protein